MQHYLEILRPYQKTLLEDTRDRFRQGDKGVILQLATGGGKSKILAAMLRSSFDLGRKILVLADRGELIKQMRQHLLDIGIPKTDIGIIKAPKSGTHPFTPDRPVQVATIQSFQSFLKDWEQWRDTFNFDFIVIDECHKRYKGYEKVKELFPNARIVGASATPVDKEGKKFNGLYQSIVCGIPYAELQARGYLPRSQYYATKAPDLKGVKVSNGDYVEKDLEIAVNKSSLRGDLVRTWREKVQAKYGDIPTIGFAVNCEHSRAIVADFQAAGINAIHCDGKMSDKERLEVLRKFISGEAPILYQVALLTEGFDLSTYCKTLGLPEISVGCVQLAAPSRSIVKAQQARGRARGIMIDGEKVAIFLDHAGICEEHGYPEDPHEWSLEGVKKKKSGKFKRCPEEEGGCGYAQVPKSATHCSECGFEFQEIEDEDKEPRAEMEHDKNIELTLAKMQNSDRFARILAGAENHMWAVAQLAAFSPDYDEIYYAIKQCKTLDGKSFKIAAVFYAWVKGQRIARGDRWCPTEEEFLEIAEKLVQRKEKPLNTFFAWVSVNQEFDSGWVPTISVMHQFQELAGYSAGWIARTRQEMRQRIPA